MLQLRDAEYSTGRSTLPLADHPHTSPRNLERAAHTHEASKPGTSHLRPLIKDTTAKPLEQCIDKGRDS